MRIITGQWRGRRLEVPNQDITRPTMDRTREAVFGILRARDVVRDAQVMDIFAGSGAYGFEALSQGASHVTFIESNKQAQQAIQANITTFGCTAQATLLPIEAKKIPITTQSATLVFMDPPYHSDLIAPTLDLLKVKGWITAGSLLVIELHKDEADPSHVTILDSRRYGVSKIVLCLMPANIDPSK